MSTTTPAPIWGTPRSDYLQGTDGPDEIHGYAEDGGIRKVNVTLDKLVGWASAIGTYLIAEDGSLTDARMLVEGVTTVKGVTTVGFEVPAGASFGFFTASQAFIATNGDALNGRLEIRTEDGKPATFGTTEPLKIFAIDAAGDETELRTPTGLTLLGNDAVKVLAPDTLVYSASPGAAVSSNASRQLFTVTGEIEVGKGEDGLIVAATPLYNSDHPGDHDIILGGAGNDTIYGGQGDDQLFGGNGADTLYGGEGADALVGGDGDDELYGGSGNDVLYGGSGNDLLRGGEGDDLLGGGNGADTIEGGEGDDVIFGEDGDDSLDGGSGDDRIHGGRGNDTMHGGEGDDTLYGENGADEIYGGEGNDEIYGGDGTDLIWGDTGNDTIYGGAAADTIHGGEGDDLVFGGGGFDVLYGGRGADVMFGDEGNDYLDGSHDDDVLYGGTGSDTLIGGEGNDTLFGGQGADTFVWRTQDVDAWTDEIMDFEVRYDKIDLSNLRLFEKGWTADSFLSDAMCVNEGGAVELAIDELRIIVNNNASNETQLVDVWSSILFA